MDGKSSLQRAFELADRGFSLNQIREALSSEGYDKYQIVGPTVIRQLAARIRAAKGNESPAPR